MLDPNKAVEQMQSEFSAGFQAGAASRDAEIQRLQMALADAEALELGTAEKCDQLRAELVKALAACKLKDEALEMCKPLAAYGIVGSRDVDQAKFQAAITKALAIQPDDAALKAWLGEPVAWTNPKHDYFERTTPSTVFGSHTIPLHSPKELK